MDGLKKHSGQWMCMVVWHGRVVGEANMFGEKIYGITSHNGIQLQDDKHNKVEKRKKNCAICEYVSSSKIGETPY